MSSNAGAPFCSACGHCHYYVCWRDDVDWGDWGRDK